MYQLKSQHGLISGKVANLKWDEGNEDKKIGSGVTVTYDFSVSPDDPVTTFHYDEVIVCTGWKYIDTKVIILSISIFLFLKLRAICSYPFKTSIFSSFLFIVIFLLNHKFLPLLLLSPLLFLFPASFSFRF